MATADSQAMRDLRAAARKAMNGRPWVAVSGLSYCSKETIARLLSGQDVRMSTAVRFFESMGYRLRIAVEKDGDGSP
jgi:hypothetical protein